MAVMMAIGWISIMLLFGMVLRAKVKFLRGMLMPASVIGGIIGFLVLNSNIVSDIDYKVYSDLVNFLFTLSFISIGLTGVSKEEKKDNTVSKEIVKGSMGMGFIWTVLYAITPVIGYYTITVLGAGVEMDGLYGLMIPFAFCQGPGQSVAFGTIIERGGWSNATQVAVTYASIGFLFAFLIGVPIAKYGIKKGFAQYSGSITESIAKGIYSPKEQKESCGKITTYSGNIDVLAFHFALIGLCFILAQYLGKIFSYIPGYFGETFSSMTFLNGMLCAYLVKWIMRKLGIEKYHDSILQTRITGLCTDFLVCGAFMSIQISIISRWILPIIGVCIITGVVTLMFALYFGPRLGGRCDFERTLGLWGCLTGTCPTGVALIRIVDPHLQTTAATEMGAMNIAMLPSYFVTTAILGYSIGQLSFFSMLIQCIITFLVILVLMKVLQLWGKPTFSFKKKEEEINI